MRTSKELLLQEGHSKEVYSIDFQNDGALLASGYVYILLRSVQGLDMRNIFSGLDSIGRVWDLRTGKTAMVLDGHVQPIYAIAFSPNGYVAGKPLCTFFLTTFYRYQVATGAGDDSIRIWDMRSLQSLYTIPAHNSIVSDIRFFHANDVFHKPPPASSTDVNMDGDTNGSADSPQPNGTTGSSVAATPAPTQFSAPDTNGQLTWTDEEWRYRSGLFFASSGYDGFVKLWGVDDWQLLKTLSTDGGKVMSVDVTSDGNMIASGTYNRNYQLFTPE